MTTLLIEEETADALRAAAGARGVTVDVFLRQIALEAPCVPPSIAGNPVEVVHEFDQALDELFAGDSRKLPSGPFTYSRGDIYFDHD